MQNLKIKVNSEAESKEAQELLFKLGAKKALPDIVCFSKNVRAVCCICNSVLVNTISFESCSSELKEITLPELRDMVVLKRNCISDATHYDSHITTEKIKCILIGEWWNAFTGGKWQQHCHVSSGRAEYMKPIEKTMREFLNINTFAVRKSDENGNIAFGRDHADWIEIPEGATYYATDSNLGIKKNYFFRCPDDAIWIESQWMKASFSVAGQAVLWQRESEQDEPFLTPETTLNDQYAEIEQVRQEVKDNVNHPSHYTQGKVECIDALESATIGKSGIEAVCVANVIKYLWRYEEKNGVEDIKKAKFYLNRLLATLENNNG